MSLLLLLLYPMHLIRLFVRFLGGNPRDLPHPGADWGVFRNKIKELNNSHPKVFCTLSNTMKPWIDMKQLDKIYASENKALSKSSSSSCVVM